MRWNFRPNLQVLDILDEKTQSFRTETLQKFVFN